MAHPLTLNYHWQPPVVITSIGAILLSGVLIRSDTAGKWSVVSVVLLAWLAFLAVVWVRTRASMMHDGETLRVRRVRDFHDLPGRRVQRVKEVMTPQGPCYRVWIEGHAKPYFVPTALLRSGHSTFFTWLLTWAPEAPRDKGSEKTITALRTRGLID